MDFPAVNSMPSKSMIADCVCPACLTQKTNEVIAKQIDTALVHHYAPPAATAFANQPLIEGLDYEVDNEGRWVFTRWFLLRRGKCCGIGCTNCPYGHINVKQNA
jgi:hypothetical protein